MDIDRKLIDEYVADNNLSGFYTNDDENIFVSISKEGEGTESPSTTSEIDIIYTGYLLDGTVF